MRITLVIALAISIALPTASPSPAAQTGPITAVAVDGPVVIQPVGDSTLRWNGRTYRGPFEIRAFDGGLAVVEHLSLDRYLYGIQEVPFSWEAEALKAQAVAARTFLVRTISNGRSGSAATYGFDICATDQCQVYRGLDKVLGPDGDRWAAAVDDTATEILLYDGKPALTMYSSTAGHRTRSIEDVFGTSATPYLVGVESPGEKSPYVDWTISLSGPSLTAILVDAELAHGALESVSVRMTDDGGGSWTVTIESSEMTETISTWSFRRAMNASGPRIRPDQLPAARPDGKLYPQSVLSPTFEVERSWSVSTDFSAGYLHTELTYDIVGHGWGHQIGMSQYGAQAMASTGSTYDEILSHYYTGLSPEPAQDHLPAEVEVGLGWGLDHIELDGLGTFDIVVDGETLAEGVDGTWTFLSVGATIEIVPPGGFGLPPVLSDIPQGSHHQAGFVVQVIGELSKPGETRLIVMRGPRVIEVGEWKERSAGSVSFVWDTEVAGSPAPPGPYRFILYTRDDTGSTVQTVIVWIDP